MKKLRILAIFAVVSMLVIGASACGGGNDETEEEQTVSSDTSDATEDEAGGEHEIYSYLPDTSLSGFMNPNDIPDRTDIEKALPFAPKDPNNVVIGWTEITQSDAWFASVYEGAKDRTAEYGYTLYFDVAEHDLQTQGAQIDSYIARGVDIIVVDPTDVVGVAADIQRAVDAGIPVLGFGSEIFGAPVITTITGNTFENGFVNGQYAGKEYYDPSEVINCGVVIGVMGNSTAESRVNGMMSGFIYGRAQARGENISKEDAVLVGTKLFKDLVQTGKFSSDEWGFNCLAWGEGMWTEEGGLQVTENIITAGGDALNLILAENDFQGSGAAQAIQNYNLQEQIKILCPGNGMREFFPLIQDGIIISNGSHNGYAFATAAIDMIKEMAEGTNSYDLENLPGLTAFDPLSINGENWESYWDSDESNWYHKTPPLKILTIPELRQAILDGTYGS